MLAWEHIVNEQKVLPPARIAICSLAIVDIPSWRCTQERADFPVKHQDNEVAWKNTEYSVDDSEEKGNQHFNRLFHVEISSLLLVCYNVRQEETTEPEEYIDGVQTREQEQNEGFLLLNHQICYVAHVVHVQVKLVTEDNLLNKQTYKNSKSLYRFC